MRRLGLQAELLLSLAFVMLAASTVLAGVLFLHEEGRLRDLLSRGLLAEARRAPGAGLTLIPGTLWWRVSAEGKPEALGTHWIPLDEASRGLVERAREAEVSLVQPGAPWHAIRFAVPEGDGSVLVARLPREASWRLRAAPLAVLAAVLLADVLVFAAFGVSLLRRRVVLPLRRVSQAARGIADGAFEARVPVEGPRECADLADAFNEMTEALERRTHALEKAVVDLRQANQSLRETREGLERAQRLAAVGRLAAGVAHEVGNPMGAILALLDLAARDETLSEGTRAHVARAAEQGERVRRILRQLLEFSRPPRTVRVRLDLPALVHEVLGVVSAQPGYRTLPFEVDLDESLPAAEGDPGAVAQILLNLVLNACDAARASEAPRIWVQLRGAVAARRAGDDPERPISARPPDVVECVVADNGCGVAPEDRERVFDPFFTTKGPGEGTGLGLANSRRLAEELGGTLELVEPPAPAVTAFALRLPCAGSGPREAAASRHPAESCAVRNGLRRARSLHSPAQERKHA